MTCLYSDVEQLFALLLDMPSMEVWVAQRDSPSEADFIQSVNVVTCSVRVSAVKSKCSDGVKKIVTVSVSFVHSCAEHGKQAFLRT